MKDLRFYIKTVLTITSIGMIKVVQYILKRSIVHSKPNGQIFTALRMAEYPDTSFNGKDHSSSASIPHDRKEIIWWKASDSAVLPRWDRAYPYTLQGFGIRNCAKEDPGLYPRLPQTKQNTPALQILFRLKARCVCT